MLGGVSLAGGKGGLVGPIVAVFILRLVRQDLTFLSIDPNVSQVIEGTIMVSGGHGRWRGGHPEQAAHELDTAAQDPPSAAPRQPWVGPRRLMRDRPIIPLLLLLLVLLVVLLELIRRASSTSVGSSTTIKVAIPLAILAAAQTLTMMTGGIDLSVGDGGHHVRATSWPHRSPARMSIAASCWRSCRQPGIGLVSGIGVGIFRVHPLIMTLSMAWS